MRIKSISVIAKPTHDCNLSCKYCYITEKAEKGKMSSDILKKSISRISDFYEKSNWIWHGGEPLLMGLDFFKEVKEVQDFYRKKGRFFSNGIQTNGTLINSELVDFVKREKDFYLGTSLDGPANFHDLTRIFPDGSGSFKEVFSGVKLAKQNLIGGGAICVISSKNVNHPEELYNFFKGNKINVKFNPLIKSGKAEVNFNTLSVTPKDYGIFLTRLWDIYDADVKKENRLTIDVDPFMEVLGNLATNRPLGCNYSSSCRDNFISIGPLGDIYPCGRFDGIKDFWMGNVKDNTIEEVLNSEVHKKLAGRKLESISSCLKCDYSKICNSGCMHNAYSKGDILGKDNYCASYKVLFNHLEKVLNNVEVFNEKD